MAALTLLPQRFLYSVGAGGAIVAIFAAFGALFLVPSLLAVLGERVNALSLRRGPALSDESGGWYQLASGVMRHPVAVALATAALLFSSPSRSWGQADHPRHRQRPRGEPLPRGVATINRDYPTRSARRPGHGRWTCDRRPVARLSRRIAAVEGIGYAVPFQRVAPDLAVANFGLRGTPTSPHDESQDTVRDRSAPRTVRRRRLVAGFTAEFLDLKTSLRQNMPLVIAIITLTTLILLFC